VYTKSDLVISRVWRHLKRGTLYHVLGIATCSTNGEREGKEESVIYFGVLQQQFYYREITEFLDGRFEPVPVQPRREGD
jgi:hypothetical protein